MLAHIFSQIITRHRPPFHLWPGAVVFITGGVIMVMELVGSRLVAPYFGTSTFIWTGLIGIILAFLSLGYTLGGRLADRYLSPIVLASIILAASAAMVTLSLITEPVLQLVQANFNDIRLAITLAAALLFGLPTVLLAMVTPYTTRLAMTQLKTSGQAVGTIYALSTLGSIVGTFATGFFLLAWFGSQTIILLLAGLLLVTAAAIAFFFAPTDPLARRPQVRQLWLVACLGILIALPLRHLAQRQLPSHVILDRDTAYQRLLLWRAQDARTQRPALFLSYDPRSAQSAMFLDQGGQTDDQLVFDYTKFFRLGTLFRPELTRTLMIGGGGYSYPKEFLQTMPAAKIDVVEIDPAVTKVAHQYFQLPADDRLTTYHQDGRQFLLGAKPNSYDVIYLDAFGSSYSVPFHLTTLETVTQFDQILQPNGLVIMNIISAIDGEYGDFFQAEYATYQAVFPYLYTFQVQENIPSTQPQNLILVAAKQPLPVTSQSPELAPYLARLYSQEIGPNKPILTDAFAPVEHYLWPLQRTNWK
jgi:spermidine synthase